MLKNYDCIAAVSSPPGKGGVAIIRVSGADAAELADKVFLPINKKPLSSHTPRMQVYGHVVRGGEKIDDCLATYFKAPNSYTGEDTVEISCHGGRLVTSLVLEALIEAGARAAEAGEFTKRAFINGKLSLTEAEAIGNLLEAESREQVRLSSGTSRKRLASEIAKIREELVGLMSSIYARIDYPDEDLGDFTDAEVLDVIEGTQLKIEALRATYRTGRAIGEGIRAAIVGKPNVGKSTFYNALVGEERAIVTDVAGTTRDVISERIPLGKIMLRLSDTAGIRDEKFADKVEAIGIEKSRRNLRESELIFTIFDLSRPFDDDDLKLLDEVREADGVKIAILNKTDLEEKFDERMLCNVFSHTLRLSARSDDCHTLINRLGAIVDSLFTDEKIRIGDGAVISSARQNASLTRASEALSAAIENLSAGFPQDLVSGDVEQALEAISELDGQSVSEEIVADIFSKFCVGK